MLHTNIELSQVISLQTEQDVDDFIHSIDVADVAEYPVNHKFVWRLLNDSVSNAANIHTTSVTIAPIIERITNGFDAVIQDKEYQKNNGKPLDHNKLPTSPREAAKEWFNIPGGDTAIYGAGMKDSARSKMADEIVTVELLSSENPRNPTVVISDHGIGQSPDDFDQTLMSLGRSNKFSSPHLHGTYGHGGSSSYRYCKYSVIISRRNPKTLHGKEDEIGWTIVRREEGFSVYDFKGKRTVEIVQPPVYLYLCLANGSIPKIPLIDNEFEKGTRIAHIKYDAKEWENLSRGLGYRLFRNYLFDPVLPFRLIDRRKTDSKTKPSFERNMFGDRSTLETADYVVYKNQAEEEWPNGGKLIVRYWLLHKFASPEDRPLKNHLERENSQNTIIATLNGQRHGSFEKRLIAKKCRLPRVSDCLLVQVVLDQLPREVKGKIFTSTRMSLVKEGTEIELLEKKLIECFTEDERLKEWETKLSDLRSEDDDSIKAVNKLLTQLIEVGQNIGIGGLQQKQNIAGTGTTNEFSPQDPPTIFKIKSIGDPLEFIKNETKTFNIELNGPNSLFTRPKNRGVVKCILPDDPGIEVSIQYEKFSDGKLPVKVFCKSDATEYDVKEIKFIFAIDSLLYDFVDKRKYLIIPPLKYIPKDPPTTLSILKNSPIKIKIGKNNAIPIGFDGPDDILVRTTNPAYFSASFNNHESVRLIRRLGPASGRIQITINPDSTAKEGDTFELSVSLTLSDGTRLSDKKTCEFVFEKEIEKTGHGGIIESSKPNFSIKGIHQSDWAVLGWDKFNVGTHELKSDSDKKDILFIYVNLDSQYLLEEIERRKNLNYSASNISNIENKYLAYLAYHLYLQYESEKAEYNQTVDSSKDVDKEENIVTKEQTELELERVAKTLILSFRSLKDLESN
jgi:hypothetical protein